MNPNPNSSHPMCDCPTFHDRQCFFYDEEIDGPESRFAMPPASSLYEDDDYRPTTALTSMPGGTTSTTTSYVWSSCKHNMSPYVLPSGLTVHASAWRDVPYSRVAPDVGIYLDPSWFPADGFAYGLSWQDFGLPTVSDHVVLRTARATLAHLSYGETVEVGCLGAHGRTGTFLALLTILDSYDTPTVYGYRRAITAVRNGHCPSAIETKGQETYLRRMSGALKRGDI